MRVRAQPTQQHKTKPDHEELMAPQGLAPDDVAPLARRLFGRVISTQSGHEPATRARRPQDMVQG